MTFRYRILIAMLPLVILLVALGVTGMVLIYYLGDQVGKILTENYNSVVFMRDLNEALERIDSSFQFALAGQEALSVEQFHDNWKRYDASLVGESHNITLDGEKELDDRLVELSDAYRKLGREFYEHPDGDRKALYFGAEKKIGLYGLFKEIKAVSSDILHMNEQNMKDVDSATKRLARDSLIWYGAGLAGGIVLAALLVASTIRTIIYPVRAATESAVAIGAGNLNQVVPITSDDELGQLAAAFNTMARQLREYRQTHKAQLIRAADQPGHDRFLPRTGVGGRSGASRGDGQPGRPPPFRLAAAGRRQCHHGRLGAARSPGAALDGSPLPATGLRARRLRQGHLAAAGRKAFLVFAARASNPRCRRGHVGGRRIAGGRDSLPAPRRGEEQHGGHGQPRAEDSLDEHSSRAASSAPGGRRAAIAEATGVAGRRPRQCRKAIGHDQ